MENNFENKNGSIYALSNCTFIISKANMEELPSGNFDCLLFGSLLVYEKNKEKKYATITLATRVELSIYATDQYYIDEDDHYIITYNAGDKVIESEAVGANIKNVSDVFTIFLNGNVSPLISREKYYDILMNSMNTNEYLSFPKVFIEMAIGDLFLDSTKKYPARLTEQNGVPVSIKEAVLSKNTFNSMTFEDWSKATYINKKKSFADQEKDPSIIEKYMRK